MPVVTVERKILKKNDEFAAENRNIFQKNKVFMINLLQLPRVRKNQPPRANANAIAE